MTSGRAPFLTDTAVKPPQAARPRSISARVYLVGPHQQETSVAGSSANRPTPRIPARVARQSSSISLFHKAPQHVSVVVSGVEGSARVKNPAIPHGLQADRIASGVQCRQQRRAGARVRAPGLHPAIRDLDHEFFDLPDSKAGRSPGDKLTGHGVPVPGGPPSRAGVSEERGPGGDLLGGVGVLQACPHAGPGPERSDRTVAAETDRHPC